MTGQEILAQAEQMAQRISGADQKQRLELHPQFSQLLMHLEVQGLHVPGRLRCLNAALIEESVEARFDNMPV
ncbi:hypothetical protein [Antarcticimicrobium sediminis]|uniref:Uncharacterized protein n=1 Tax=Antarcticimicrobium sediminis TaxID=2546227 RepID=A0A4R5ET48_9RHOB|nr:hypothetical protein [Antarcticimicrobium sediminis]TDE38039.1 hypothetical protein E1B25_11485 [Antarcticimicrobium sediminis]